MIGATAEQWTALESYFRDLLNRLELRDWTFTVDREPATDGVEASVNVCENRKWVTLYVSAGFAGYSPKRRRHALVHEALHCHFDEAHRALVGTRDLLGASAFTMADGWFRSGIEHGVDAVADIIAPLMPLLEWPPDIPAEAENVTTGAAS